MPEQNKQSAVVQLNAAPRFRRPSQRTFICAGVVRGGTSAVGGLMQRLGVFMGKDLGNNYEDPGFIGKPIAEMKALIQARNAEHKLWGWKSPHVANHLDHLLSDIRNPHLIVVCRDLVATMRAHTRWHGRDARHAAHEILLMLHRNWFLVERSDFPTLLVSYEKLLLAPDLFVEELADFIGVSRPQGVELTEAAEFLAPGSYK